MRNNVAKCLCPFPLPLEKPSCTLPWAASTWLRRVRMGVASTGWHGGLPELCYMLLPSRGMLKKPFSLIGTSTLSCNAWEKSRSQVGFCLGLGHGAGTPHIWEPTWCCVIYQNCINPTNTAAIWPCCRAGSREPPVMDGLGNWLVVVRDKWTVLAENTRGRCVWSGTKAAEF